MFLLLLSLVPIIMLGSISLITMNSAKDMSIEVSSESLLDLTNQDLEEITLSYSRSIDDYFRSVKTQLDESTVMLSQYWNNPYYIDLFEDTDETITNRYFYGEINGILNGTVDYFDTGDYVDYDSDGDNDFVDFGADMVGAGDLDITGAVDLSVNASYSGALVSSDAFVKLRVYTSDGSKVKLDIKSHYIANGNQWSTLLADEWSPSNPDQLTGPLSGLHDDLVEMDATYIYPYFYVYDESATHQGSIRQDTPAHRFEGVIKGEINGTYHGILRGLVNLTIDGDSDERLAFVDTFMAQIYKQNQPTFSWVYLAIPDTGYLYQYPWNPNYIDGSWIYMGSDYDARDRAWYIETMDQEQAMIDADPASKGSESFWTDLVVDANTREVAINVGRVIYDSNGDMVGPFEFKIVIEQIQQTVLDLKVGSSGYGFLINQAGSIMASPDYVNKNDTVPLSSADDFASGNLLNTNNTALKAIITEMVNGEQGIDEAEFEGQDAIISYAPIETNGWSFGVILSKSEVLAPVNDLENDISGSVTLTLILILMVIVGTVIVVTGAAMWLAKNIADPIVDMTKLADEISRGNFQVKLDEYKTEDEIGQLANAFERMATSLQILMKRGK